MSRGSIKGVTGASYFMLGLLLVSPLWGFEPLPQFATALRFLAMVGLILAGFRFIQSLDVARALYGVRWFTVAVTAIALVGIIKIGITYAKGVSPSDSRFQTSVALLLGLYWPTLYALLYLPLSRRATASAHHPGTIAVIVFLTLAIGVLGYFGPMRSTILGLTLAIIVFVACHRYRQYFLTIAVALAFLVCGPVLLVINSMVDITTLLETFRHTLNQSAQHRLVIWWETSQHILDAPLLGYGIEASRYIVKHVCLYIDFVPRLGPHGEALLARGAADILPPFHSHNGPLQLLLETGIIGYTLITAIILRATYCLGAHFNNRPLFEPNPLPWMAASLMGLLVPFCLNFGLWQMHWISVQALTLFSWTLVLRGATKGR